MTQRRRRDLGADRRRRPRRVEGDPGTARTFGVTDLAQDGYAAGELIGVQFEDNGIVMARYSNGQTKPAGQIEIASFRNPQGLQPLGGNGWSQTSPRAVRSSASRATATSASCRPARSRNRTST